MTCSLLVPEPALDKLLRRLDKLAASTGVLIEVMPGTTTLIKEGRTVACSRVSIGALPAENGYTFSARIEHLKGGNVIARSPSETVDLEEEWRQKDARCEHCGKKRSRKETFLLRQYGIRLMQIGRNCLADFLQTNPVRLVAQAELVHEIHHTLSDEFWGSCAGYWGVAPVYYIACAVASTERHGFVKSGSEGRTTRVDADWLSGMTLGHNAYPNQHALEQPTEDQIETAHEIVRWVMAQSEAEGCSEYLWNLRMVIAAGSTSIKHSGLLASAPAAYFRHLGREVVKRHAEVALPRPEGYVVEKGWRFEGVATLIRHALVPGEWGSTAICTFRTDSGHEVVWFASGVAPKSDMQGMKFQIKGRCHEHQEYRGVKQAVLKRVTWKPCE